MARRTTKTNMMIVTVFFTVIILAGLVQGARYLFYNGRENRQETNCTAEITGVITESEKTWSSYSNSNTRSYGSTGRYRYKVKAEYKVDGKVYEARRSSSHRYAKGDECTVYYDPGDPKLSYIDQLDKVSVNIKASSMAMLVSGGLGLVVTVLKYRREYI
ncbi:MAG: DUF3592 domain-containing protein [Ruminococcus sp.]|nr:DUF3592 domain-containing protein [Ruminococcus sp.]